MRHRRFEVTTKAADRWMYHMEKAINHVDFTKDQRDMLIEFFKDVAYFLRNVTE